eukprot:417161-Rhodomonas_salina.1
MTWCETIPHIHACSLVLRQQPPRSFHNASWVSDVRACVGGLTCVVYLLRRHHHLRLFALALTMSIRVGAGRALTRLGCVGAAQVHALQHTCEWKEWEKKLRLLQVQLSRELAAGGKPLFVKPFHALVYPLRVDHMLLVAESYAARFWWLSLVFVASVWVGCSQRPEPARRLGG